MYVSITVWVPEFVLACPCVCVCVGHVAERALSLYALRGYGAQNENGSWKGEQIGTGTEATES